MAAVNIPLLTLTGLATAAVAKARAVGFDDVQASVAGQKVKGVASAPAAASGDTFPMVAKGTAIAETGADIAAGDDLVCDAQGRVVPADPLEIEAGAVAVTSSAANGAVITGGSPAQCVFARALETSTGAGKFVEILFL